MFGSHDVLPTARGWEKSVEVVRELLGGKLGDSGWWMVDVYVDLWFHCQRVIIERWSHWERENINGSSKAKLQPRHATRRPVG